jgi:hypothetical protein
MLRELLPHAAGAVFTRSGNPRALSPATLESLAGQLGSAGEIEPDPHARGRRAPRARRPGRRRRGDRLDLPRRRSARGAGARKRSAL